MKTTLPILTALALAGCCGPKYSQSSYRTPLPAARTQAAAVEAPRPPLVEPPVTRAAPPVVAPAVATREIPADEQDVDALELKRESLAVRKATVSNGRAVLRKTVTEKVVAIPTVLRSEDFTVERIPVDDPVNTPFGSGEAELSLLLTKEVATPEVSARVYERVKIKKIVNEETQSISATVREEKLETNREP